MWMVKSQIFRMYLFLAVVNLFFASIEAFVIGRDSPQGFMGRHVARNDLFFMPETGRSQTSSSLWGIVDWRDHDFGLPGSAPKVGVQTGNRGPPKSICLLPFPYQDVLLQGETKQLRLYEDRFIKLFHDVMDNHDGVVGMGLMAQSGVIQTVPLCEVEAYNTMEGFGIFVTIRCVGRAQLLELSQQQPYLKGTCLEIMDNLPPNLELLNLLAGNIENFMLLLSSMENRLNQAQKKNGFEDKDMDRRIAIAKLEDRFYMSDDEGEEEDDEDTDDSFGDLDRLGRFRRAYEVAMATDTQGYTVSSSANRDESLSPRELTAVSWAAFSSELVPSSDATYRIQALDADQLFLRLKLAFQMLREKKAQLRVKMQKAGIRFRGEDLDEDEPTLDK